jgi:hypothetical protein
MLANAFRYRRTEIVLAPGQFFVDQAFKKLSAASQKKSGGRGMSGASWPVEQPLHAYISERFKPMREQ